MLKFLFNIVFILFLSAELHAQQKYWIYFKDKKEAFSDRPDLNPLDVPVSNTYLDSLARLNYCIVEKSRWLNAASAIIEKKDIHLITQLGFVKNVAPVSPVRVLSYPTSENKIGLALKQINADTLIFLGLHGKGVKVGIIDGGFLNADKGDHPLGNLAAYRNYIERDIQNPFVGTRRNGDDHGADVWRLIGGYDKKRVQHHGLASAATYYLARTDQGDKEFRGEEDNWIAALEWMHDQGVTVVNSSLGYTDGYDDPKENYQRKDVDGKSSAITQAATIAANEKGMVLVISAGNDGAVPFEIISIPADAPGIISVGATGIDQWTKQRYSSIGPEDLSYIKPEVACYAAGGTSFSAPIITGLIASVLEAYPGLSSTEMVALLKKSSHLYPYPNNYLGYGVPDAKRMLKLLNNERAEIDHEIILCNSDSATINLNHDNVVIFHKKNETHVMDQHKGRVKRGVLTIMRISGARFSTVATPEKIYEIVWE